MTNRRDFLTAGAMGAAFSAIGSPASAQTALPAGTQPPSESLLGKSFAETAAPKLWTLPQRPASPVSIDIHTHWAPEAYLKAKAEFGQPDFLDPINYDMDRRIAWMDTRGVQALVLTLGGFRPWGWVTPEQGAHIARVTNDAAIDVHKSYPSRFHAGIEVNCSDPRGSLAELNRMAGKPGMVCLHLPTSLAGRDFMFDPDFAPVLARAEALSLPIILHPLDGAPNWFGGHRLADAASGASPNASPAGNRFPGLTNSLGNSLEIAVCMSKLMASGTLDRYPNLTFIAQHAGGALPYVGGRLENRGGGTLKKPAYEYLRRFYYDSLAYWPDSLRYLVHMVGPDRVVLGTDNMFGPGPLMVDQPHSVIDHAGLADADRDLILSGNLKRLLAI